MPYATLQQNFDAGAPYGIRSYWKSTFIQELPDEAIDAFVDCATTRTSPRTMVKLEHLHGAVSRVAPHKTAFPARGAAFNLVVLSLWDDARHDARNLAWTREFYTTMRAWSAGISYINALGEDDGARVREAYGDNYARLARVKAKYDPANRFRRNHNIAPALVRANYHPLPS
jgi:FAD/FMN-containing dehydrogenase